MASKQPQDVYKHLLDLERKQMAWAPAFQGVKAIVRANSINDETSSCIKAWLKSTDSCLHQPLVALTVCAIPGPGRISPAHQAGRVGMR